MPLDQQAAEGLAGGDVTTLAEARTVEAVSQASVDAAVKAASEAEAAAGKAETAAVTGKGTPAEATAAAEIARFARLKAHVAARRAERTRQAQRLLALHQAGTDALAHAAELKQLRDDTLADLATINDLHAAIGKRIRDWNAGLGDLIAKAAVLEPEKPRPGLLPTPSSADVYAAATNPVFVVKHQVLTPIRTDHPDGPVAAIEEAHRVTREHDASVRLVITPGGLVQPYPADPYGHTARRIASGESRELTLAEKKRYYAGEQVSF